MAPEIWANGKAIAQLSVLHHHEYDCNRINETESHRFLLWKGLRLSQAKLFPYDSSFQGKYLNVGILQNDFL